MTRQIEYYAIMPSTDLEEVGSWPQIDDIDGLTRSEMEAFSNLITLNILPETLPRNEGYRLNSDARATDLLSNRFVQHPVGLTVSRRMWRLLEQFDLANTRLCDISIMTSDGLQARHVLLVAPSPSLVDFSQSTYVETDILGQAVGPDHQFPSLQELDTKAMDLVVNFQHDLAPRSIVLSHSPDLLRIPQYYYVLVSEKLMKSINTEELSGLAFERHLVDYSVI